MMRLTGIGASEGVAIGKVLIFHQEELEFPKEKFLSSETAESEIIKLEEAMKKSKTQLISLREKVRAKLGNDKADIFDGHILLLEDEDLMDEITAKIKEDGLKAPYALKEGIDVYCEMLSQLDDPYLRERVADFQDIGTRWLKNLLNIKIKDLSNLEPNTIIVTNDLTPSDTAQLDLEHCKGFVTEVGGKTAHSAIMARSLEIPAVVGTKSIITTVKDGEDIIIDGDKGEIYLSPTPELVKEFEVKRLEQINAREELKKLKDLKTITKDGHEVEIWGNIGKPEDVEAVIEAGATGIGLYRTEFLFMNSDHMPTEEEQYRAYRAVVEKMNNNPVTIRTMDIGGDKELPYLDLPKELNPFLGYRAIRISLVNKEMFKTQLRAILRASAYGIVKIMYPMISSIKEVRLANQILEECKAELDAIGKKFDRNIKVGIMIETPSSAIIAYKFAKEVDFFSIGTNDLTQYFLAVDRGNEMVSDLYSAFNPAVLEAIQKAIDAAHNQGISISMCGEFAGNKDSAELLLGMGLDAFSMSASSVLKVKKKILECNYADAQKYRDLILSKDTTEEVIESLR
ncbi:phosphoenolpyruvate--protein phosphotransferase [Pseudostreptobacillus hongkongensis]|uniref:phosphoenolpyruvate--protein phosphotransferase n=1 Tax=Pseudostreptobacillus hongkongensis TaxID=1162717 RepID=UPI0028D347DA|nr:phosphoenolpyruvate--protein phosphotransferase [Pseudostreptobacillus hongkongensis]